MCFSTRGGGSPTKAEAEQKNGGILGVNRPEIAGVDHVDHRHRTPFRAIPNPLILPYENSDGSAADVRKCSVPCPNCRIT